MVGRTEGRCFLPNTCHESWLRGKTDDRGTQGRHSGLAAREGLRCRAHLTSLPLLRSEAGGGRWPRGRLMSGPGWLAFAGTSFCNLLYWINPSAHGVRSRGQHLVKASGGAGRVGAALREGDQSVFTKDLPQPSGPSLSRKRRSSFPVLFYQQRENKNLS